MKARGFDMTDFKTAYEMDKAMVDRALDGYFSDSSVPFGRLLESMHYSLTAGGKRLRPVLVLAFCRACGGDVQKALPAACAMEMVHTYSLIHDDLPCMDNDDLRRGKPTNHVVFGECTATLAGDALQAEAFRTILESDLPVEARAECARLLAEAAGIDGICGGQQLDMEGDGKILNRDQLIEIHTRKTAAMIRAACRMGIACGNGSDEQIQAAEVYAQALGLAFQIRDDMLDVISTDEELGKPIGSDAEEQKTTFMSLYGLEKCREEVHALTEQAAAAVESVFSNAAFLQELVRSLESRRS